MIVKDFPNLIRDSQSKAIINQDTDGYNNYIKERNFKSTLTEVVSDVNSLKKDIQEIKYLLIKLTRDV
jgi:hypothetical protein